MQPKILVMLQCFQDRCWKCAQADLENGAIPDQPGHMIRNLQFDGANFSRPGCEQGAVCLNINTDVAPVQIFP